MADTRIKEFTEFFHQEYKKKIGFIYNWKGGKEQKLMIKCLSYFDSIKPENALEEMKKASLKYLESEDGFYSSAAHDLSLFLTKPERWVTRPDVRQRPLPPFVTNMVVSVSEKSSFTEESFYAWMVESPLKAAKAFAWGHCLIQKRNPKFHSKIENFLIDLLGEERFKKMMEDEKSNIEPGNILDMIKVE